MNKKKPKYITAEEALAKLQRYCAYQDRCHQEVRSKLLDLGVYGDTLEEIIAELISENFLNEERFARSFARGKFRMKSWGKKRIVSELKLRNISDYCIKKALEEIEEENYEEQLKSFLTRKKAYHPEKDPYKLKVKLAQMALRRGFESELVWKTINNLFA